MNFNYIWNFFKKLNLKLLSTYQNFKNLFFKKKEHNKVDFDKKLVYSLAKSRIPKLKQFKYLGKLLNRQETLALRISFFIFFISTVFIIFNFYNNHIEIKPLPGGEYIEAMIGSPQYINPMYAEINHVDSSLEKLIFSSLFKFNEQGVLIGDLAKDYKIEDGGKVILIKIRQDVKWHDGQKLTIDDVIFTFNLLSDPDYKTSWRSVLNGINIERIDDETLKISLPEVYAPFLELLTFGIMPQFYWSNVSPTGARLAEFNLKPIGSGQYKFKSFVRNKNGQIKSYLLEANQEYYGKKPYITNIVFKFFISQEEVSRAIMDGSVDGVFGLNGENALEVSKKSFIKTNYLNSSKISVLFFNPKKNVFLEDLKVRQALAYAINKQEIIDLIFQGQANIIDGPILSDKFAHNDYFKKYQFNKDEARKILAEAGWKEVNIKEEELKEISQKKDMGQKITNEEENKLNFGVGKGLLKDGKFLSLKITVVDTLEGSSIAELIKRNWKDIGIKVDIDFFPSGLIQKEIIRPRNYEILIFSLILRDDPDPYPFWHSSQIGENGSNLAVFSNKEVDQLLEDARLTINQEIRQEKYGIFQKILADNLPAVFLFNYKIPYFQNKKIKNYKTIKMFEPADRFVDIENWYINVSRKIRW